MPPDHARATPEQFAELKLAYEEHIAALFEVARILDAVGYGADFADASERANRAYNRLKQLMSELEDDSW